MRILKFGGTSVGSIDHLRTVTDVVVRAASREPIVTVVSAFDGVTDQLTAAIDTAEAGKPHDDQWLAALKTRHLDALGELAGDAPEAADVIAARLKELSDLLAEVKRDGRCSPALRDRILATGERISAPVVAALLQQRGVAATVVDATRLIATDSNYGAARVDLAETRRRCTAETSQLGDDVVPVVTGFIGADADGNLTTLSRGGSDYSAGVLGAALDAGGVEIWTDVDGVLSADPQLVPEARLLTHLSYRAVSALAEAGARVLHPKTVTPLIDAAIPVEVRAIARPNATPTRITANGGKKTVRAVAGHRLSDQHAEVTIVSGNARIDAGLVVRALGTLNRADIEVGDFQNNEETRTLTATIPADELTRAIKLLHRVVVPGRARVALAIAGVTGRVGGELLRQLKSQAPSLQDEVGGEMVLIGAINSRRMAFNPDDGIDWNDVETSLEQGEQADWPQFADRLRHYPGRVVFVDCTADNIIGRDYTSLLNAHVAVATPNKQASTLPWEDFQALTLASRDGAPYRYSTAVGAGLPILRTLRRMRQSGDNVRDIRAVLSGTIGYVFDRLNQGGRFSSVVADAHEAGYTEPHPRDDLDGADVTRKLLIMLRESGLDFDMDDIETESLVPAALQNEADPKAFLARLKTHDEAWEKRVEAARQQGCKLGYVARYDGKSASVGVMEVRADDRVANLQGTENLAVLRTDYYNDLPVCITGPGAGVEVTAACLLADVVDGARTLGKSSSEQTLSAPESFKKPLQAVVG